MRFRPVFIIGCARSGTTAVTTILNIATNAEIFTEDPPKLCIESRNYELGKTGEQEMLLKLQESKEPRITELEEVGKIYGDKSPNYLPLFPLLEELWQPNYVLVYRDGREVVRSMMDWHHISNGSFFGMREDEPNSTVVDPAQDWWDYSRIRPSNEQKEELGWLKMSRFAKCAWHWNAFNKKLYEWQMKLPKDRTSILNMKNMNLKNIERVFDKVGLDGFDRSKVERLLSSKINSKRDNVALSSPFPHWSGWDSSQSETFYLHASDMMHTLDYI